MKNNSPCFNCEDRISGCHGDCSKYSDWKNVETTKKEKIMEAKRSNYEYEGYMEKRSVKNMRGIGKYLTV